MAKSRKDPKRKKKRRQPQKTRKGWDGKGGYTKTDSKSNTLYYDKRHRLKKVDPATPPEEQVYSLDTLWTLSNTVLVGKTVKEVIDWRPQYMEYWVKQGIKLDEIAAEYLETKLPNDSKNITDELD